MNEGHPQGKKNIIRSIEEKEQIILEYLNGKVGYRAIAKSHNVSDSVFKIWIKQYRKNGIQGLSSQTGKHHNPNRGRHNRHLSEIDKLKEQLLKKDIEIERLKKGYQVKGDGVTKEYITTFDVNMKSSKD